MVVGGGAGGCSTAAKFASKYPGQVAVIEPRDVRFLKSKCTHAICFVQNCFGSSKWYWTSKKVSQVKTAFSGVSNCSCTLSHQSHSAYDPTSTESNGVKTDGFLHPNFM